ncbi:MAG: hypothetical protein MUP24_13485 [Gillisia sp.]|nr:hypothetical protein [Gillisia sp.]
MRRVILFILVSFLISSCATTKVMVKVNTVYTNPISIDTLNLVSIMIGPVLQPVLPLIDAAEFNAKTNKIADQILDEEQKAIETYKSLLINNLKGKLNKPILTGSDFSSDPSNKYKVKNIIQIDNKNFPIVFFSIGDLNIIDFGKGKNVNSIFKNNTDLKIQIPKFASELKLKTILISYNRLNVIGKGKIGASFYLRLESYLYLYDSSGNLLIDVYAWSKPTAIEGEKLGGYKFQLDNFQELSSLMSQELLKYIK